MKEEIIVIENHSIVGILNSANVITTTTVVLLNAGMIHKVGPQRTYVKLARRLSSEGYNVFRFDYGGQGDSINNPSYSKQEGLYVTKALDFLEKKVSSRTFILMGLCSGAESAYQTALCDKRVKGVVMVNGTGLDKDYMMEIYPHAENSIQSRYYKKMFLKPAKWYQMLSTKTNVFKKIKEKYVSKAGVPERKAPTSQVESDPIEKLAKNGVAILLLISEGSTAYDLINIAYGNKINRYDLFYNYIFMKDVDHSVTPLWSQCELHDKTINWIKDRFPIC